MGSACTAGQRVAPASTLAAQISVRPAPATSSGNNSSLENSLRVGNAMAGGSEKISTDNASKNSRASRSRPGSQVSKRSNLSASMRGGRRHVGSAKRFTHGGTHSRPISSISKGNVAGTWAKVPFRGGGSSGGGDRLMSSMGLPLQRDIDYADLGSSMRAHRITTVGIPATSPNMDVGTVILLRLDANQVPEKPATCCQLCGNQFTNLGIRVPLVLLCGHSYCSNCLEKACESYPSALKCGICLILTPLDQQMAESLPKNEAILDLLSSREYLAVLTEKHMEKCAECEHRTASMFCSECSASYCNFCGKRAHEGSKVRSRHKPVPMNLKPRPQPTCRKHPGQSCVLYCETEKQPMCVLCKFYGQHRFHRYELLSKVASKYCSAMIEKLGQIEQLEKDLDVTAQSLAVAVDEIDSSARKAQERLERHFADLRKSYLASLERREAILLTLVDRQVEVKQEMLEEMRNEVAAARARALATKEEATQLLKLNPVSALLSRKHMDTSFERILKQTALAQPSKQPLVKPSIQPEVPLSLLPDITPTMAQTLNHHGAILQLPPKPWFVDISVTNNAISLQWQVSDQNADLLADRTLTYSLHCYADVPYKTKAKLNIKRRFVGKLVTPESGFEEMSEFSVSSEPVGNFPSLPSSLLGSRNISLVTVGSKTQQDQDKSRDIPEHKTTHQDEAARTVGTGLKGQKVECNSENRLESGPSLTSNVIETIIADHEATAPQKKPKLVMKPTAGKNITSLLPEPIRLPKPAEGMTEAKLPQVVKHKSSGVRPSTHGSVPDQSGAMLNLPPLIITKPKLEADQDLVSDSTASGVWGDSEDLETLCAPTPCTPRMEPLDEDATSDQPKHSRSDSSSTISDSSVECTDNHFTNVGRFCKGYAFEGIYCGEKPGFHYSGLVPGATYYFRVQCHNAAGWGPWSDTVKCMTTSGHGGCSSSLSTSLLGWLETGGPAIAGPWDRPIVSRSSSSALRDVGTNRSKRYLPALHTHMSDITLKQD